MHGAVTLCAGMLSFGVFPTTTSAQAVITGSIRDTSGAVLPGVNVEATPVLIEKARTTVTFTLPGFTTFRHEDVELTGCFVATINAELRVGTLEETTNFVPGGTWLQPRAIPTPRLFRISAEYTF